MITNFERIKAYINYDEKMETADISSQIPFINFPDDWKIQIIPPFGGATIRFRVRDKNSKDKYVSIYLDCFDHLASVNEAYWEIFPYDGDVQRCYMNETKELIEYIRYSLNEIGGK